MNTESTNTEMIAKVRVSEFLIRPTARIQTRSSTRLAISGDTLVRSGVIPWEQLTQADYDPSEGADSAAGQLTETISRQNRT